MRLVVSNRDFLIFISNKMCPTLLETYFSDALAADSWEHSVNILGKDREWTKPTGVKRISGSWSCSFQGIVIRYATTNGRSKRISLERHGNEWIYGFLWKSIFPVDLRVHARARTLTSCSSDLTIFKNTRRLRRWKQRGFLFFFCLFVSFVMLSLSEGWAERLCSNFVLKYSKSSNPVFHFNGLDWTFRLK